MSSLESAVEPIPILMEKRVLPWGMTKASSFVSCFLVKFYLPGVPCSPAFSVQKITYEEKFLGAVSILLQSILCLAGDVRASKASVCSCCRHPFEAEPIKEGLEEAQKSNWMSTPARVQVPYNPEQPQYVEGNEDFNVWYGKYLSDRRNPRDRDRVQAGHRCDPEKDSGWTQADHPGSGSPGFCLFYARGCCGFGHKCRYFHHVPTLLDMASSDEAHDIFGRERYSTHRDDMGGVGSFNTDCTTLFVGDLMFDRGAPDAVESVQRELESSFRQWGDIEDVRIVPSKAIAFVRYTWRCNAEFAKEAMAGQKLGLSKCIVVNWARDDPRPDAKKRRKTETAEQVEMALANRAAALGWTKPEIEAITTRGKPEFIGPVGPYPDTSAQFKQRAGHASAMDGVAGTVDTVQCQADLAQQEAESNMRRLESALQRIHPIQP